MKRVRVLNGYIAHARFLSDVAEEALGTIPRQAGIVTPYASSPVHIVWDHKTLGRVFVAETAHRRYEVFAVPAGMTLGPADA